MRHPGGRSGVRRPVDNSGLELVTGQRSRGRKDGRCGRRGSHPAVGMLLPDRAVSCARAPASRDAGGRQHQGGVPTAGERDREGAQGCHQRCFRRGDAVDLRVPAGLCRACRGRGGRCRLAGWLRWGRSGARWARCRRALSLRRRRALRLRGLAARLPRIVGRGRGTGRSDGGRTLLRDPRHRNPVARKTAVRTGQHIAQQLHRDKASHTRRAQNSPSSPPDTSPSRANPVLLSARPPPHP